MSRGRDALLIGAQHGSNAEGWRLTAIPFNLASGASIATITGVIKVRNLIGRCTTAVGTSSSMQLTIGGTAICASTDVVGLATTAILLRETGTATVLTELTQPIASLWAAPTELVAGVSSGTTTLDAVLNASGTGVINFALEWTPLSSNASVAASQT